MGGNVLELESDKLIKKGLEQGIEQGLERGICVLIETCRENQFPEEKLKKQLMDKFDLTETEAVDYMNKYYIMIPQLDDDSAGVFLNQKLVKYVLLLKIE